jgi:RimJ/RimL family protein N-acetyltransferase
MARNLGNPDVTMRAITHSGRLVGSIASYVEEGTTEITYWVDPAHWGEGIASGALVLFLDEVDVRPLRARAASDNRGSLRVLEKLGFKAVGTAVSHAPARGTAIEETILELSE